MAGHMQQMQHGHSGLFFSDAQRRTSLEWEECCVHILSVLTQHWAEEHWAHPAVGLSAEELILFSVCRRPSHSLCFSCCCILHFRSYDYTQVTRLNIFLRVAVAPEIGPEGWWFNPLLLQSAFWCVHWQDDESQIVNDSCSNSVWLMLDRTNICIMMQCGLMQLVLWMVNKTGKSAIYMYKVHLPS